MLEGTASSSRYDKSLVWINYDIMLSVTNILRYLNILLILGHKYIRKFICMNSFYECHTTECDKYLNIFEYFYNYRSHLQIFIYVISYECHTLLRCKIKGQIGSVLCCMNAQNRIHKKTDRSKSVCSCAICILQKKRAS